MKRIKTSQTVDCVALKRQAQAKIHAETKDMTTAEQIAYFRRRAESGALGAWWKRVSSSSEAALVVRERPGKYGK